MSKNQNLKEKEVEVKNSKEIKTLLRSFDVVIDSILKITKLILRLQEGLENVEKIMDCRLKDLETRIFHYVEKIQNHWEDEKDKIIH